jgi:hypothetical protein
MSKNIEATGERSGPYDSWRTGLLTLPSDTYITIPFVESSSLPGGDYPYFGINCVVFPRVLSQDENLTDDQYRAAVNTETQGYAQHQQWLSHLNVPVVAAVVDYNLTKFATKSLIDNSERIVSRAQFIQDVIRQRFKHGRDRDVTISDVNHLSRYSTWHRAALTSDSYVFEVNYVELRKGVPVALIERTHVTRGDRERNFFNFMTRGFTQGMVLLQIAERLGVKCFCIVYEEDMSRVLVVELNRELIEMSKGLASERAQLSNQFMSIEGLSYGHAQGKACDQLYDKYADLRRDMLAATNVTEYSRDEYQRFLESL